MEKFLSLAYLAGFFDGEGCVYILRSRKKTAVYFSLEISFTNVSIEPLKLAQELFAGQISESRDIRNGKKCVKRLRVRGNQALRALELMLPFLLVKKRRAEIAIEFQKIMSSPNKSRIRNLTVEECEKYKFAITSLNDKVWNKEEIFQKVPVEEYGK
jgi:hypothetical protein